MQVGSNRKLVPLSLVQATMSVASFVSFIDSGSLGRPHYSLVRSVETDTSGSPDRFLLDEIRSVKRRIHRASLVRHFPGHTAY